MITNVYLGIVYTVSYFCRYRQKTSYKVNFEFSETEVKKPTNLCLKYKLFPVKWFLKQRKMRYPRQIFMGNLPDGFFIRTTKDCWFSTHSTFKGFE